MNVDAQYEESNTRRINVKHKKSGRCVNMRGDENLEMHKNIYEESMVNQRKGEQLRIIGKRQSWREETEGR